MVDPGFLRRLEGYGILSVDILYRMPDPPHLLQTLFWQTDDVYPEFPAFRKYLRFWKREIEGPLHSVRLTHHKLITPTEFMVVGNMLQLH